MCDLLSILPDFSPPPHCTNILLKLEQEKITTADVLTIDHLELSRRIAISLLDLRRFTKDISRALQQNLRPIGLPDVNSHDGEIGVSGLEAWKAQRFISTTDAVLDRLLGGGVMTGSITEVVGESGAGKTQILLQLCCTVQLPPLLGGLSKTAVYISTEAPLSTPRLVQLLHAFRDRYSPNLTSPEELSTDHVFSVTCGDLESQEHIAQFQLPILVEQCNVGLVIMDSVASNFRAEHEGRHNNNDGQGAKALSSTSSSTSAKKNGPALLAERGRQLVKLGQILHSLARRYNLAVVVANQVSDKFESPPPPPSSHYTNPNSNSQHQNGGDVDVMSFDHQARWFTGWGDDSERAKNMKTPALGLVWANCIGARVVIQKDLARGNGDDDDDGSWRRRMKVVFAPWAEGGKECGYVIQPDGVKGVPFDGGVEEER